MKIWRNFIRTVLSTLTLIVLGLSHAGAESGIKNREIFVGTSARAIGMGGAYTAGPASSDSSFWNPSSLGLLDETELSLIGLPFPESANEREGAFSLALNPRQLGIASSNVGNFSVSSWFDGWGNDTEKNRMVLVGYGTSLGRGIAAGTNLRHYRHRGSINPRYAWSFDIGVRIVRPAKRPGEKITLGLALEDLGGRIWENAQTVARIPTITRLGAAHSFNQKTTLSGDFVLHNDTRIDFSERLRTHLGVERWLFKNGLGLRLGYTAILNQLTRGEWSTGLSIQSSSGQLDYAYVRGNELDGAMHWISATLRWGEDDAGLPISRPPIVKAPPATPAKPAPIVMPKPIPAALHISEEAISPNGDGVKDRIAFNLEVSEDRSWELEIRKQTDTGVSKRILQRYSGTGLPSTKIIWEGEDDAGEQVSDGTYLARWFAVDDIGNRQLQSEVKITVDTTPASLEIAAEAPVFASPDTTDPGKEVVLQMPKVHLQASDSNPIARWELQFFDENQELVQHIHEEGEPSDTVVWNNWKQSDSGQKATYRCVATVHDIAGNRSTGEASFSISKIDGNDLGDTQAAVVATPTDEKLEVGDIVLTLPGMAFEVNAYQIDPEYHPTLEKVARTIAAHPDAQITIGGHTDDSGDAGYNLELSQKRADAVMAYLVQVLGVNPSGLSAVGYGEERPIVPNDTADNRQKNRRIEIVLSTSEVDQRMDVVYDITSQLSDDTSSETPKYTLLVGSFQNRRNAESLIESLDALELGTKTYLTEVMIRSRLWYRVTLGGFQEREDAAELMSEVVELGMEPLVISNVY